MTKYFVVDTNVLLFDPQSIFKFGPGNEVVIPITVVEEVDDLKRTKMRMAATRGISRA